MNAADELIREVNRLVEASQLGRSQEVQRTAEARLRELGGGSLQDGPAAMHFVRVVALLHGADEAAMVAVNEMLAAADRENALAWRSSALSMRAMVRVLLGERDPARYDMDGVLSDLAAAEAALSLSTDEGYAARCAHVGIANSYVPLRLYELAEPHQEAAYRITLRTAGPGDAAPTMWLLNLATLHLQWALELYRVALDDEAEQHSAQAYEHAAAALARLRGDAVAAWEAPCRLIAAAARADGADPSGVVDQIQQWLPVVRALGDAHDHVLTVPFLAVALLGEGRKEEALEVVEGALAEVRVNDRESPTYLSLVHTYTLLLASGGSREARAALEYGDALAAAAWRQRQRTLDSAETMRAYAQLRAEHEQVARAAETDALTGVANRRSFDRHLQMVADAHDPQRPVGVLFIDLDEFKKINDSLGHAGGDAVLRGVANAIAANAREDDVVARIGGDEFAVLLPGADTEDIEVAARRIITAVREAPHRLITVSIGGASGPACDVQLTVARADDAMYVAKRCGRDRQHVAARLAPAARASGAAPASSSCRGGPAPSCP